MRIIPGWCPKSTWEWWEMVPWTPAFFDIACYPRSSNTPSHSMSSGGCRVPHAVILEVLLRVPIWIGVWGHWGKWCCVEEKSRPGLLYLQHEICVDNAQGIWILWWRTAEASKVISIGRKGGLEKTSWDQIVLVWLSMLAVLDGLQKDFNLILCLTKNVLKNVRRR